VSVRRLSLRLRGRLTLLSTGVLLVALVVGALALTVVLFRARVSALDQVVSGRVEQIAGLADAGTLPDALPVTQPGEIAQVLDGAGRVVATSPNASRTLPLLPAGQLESLAGQAGSGILVQTSDQGSYDGQVRVAVAAAHYRGEPVVVAASVPLGEVVGLLGALRVALLRVVPALTALFGLVVWVALGRALAPMEQLRSAAAQVARVGGPGELPVPGRDDELAALARTLNEMLDRLEAASERQRSFVADAAHELRSPLAAMRAVVEVAAAHPAAFAAGELVDELQPQVLRMGQLVDDLLVLARVGSGPRHPTMLELAGLAREVAEQVALPGGVQIRVDGSGTGHGDRFAIGRVLRNLLENAVRHAAGRVEVDVRDGRVDVDDDGAGIAEADRERVFERFVRLDDARERDSGGSGLGLAIARELAREAGGDVTVATAPIGGLRARLTLPPSTAPGAR
jgi:signal transduction histidine kinase